MIGLANRKAVFEPVPQHDFAIFYLGTQRKISATGNGEKA